jgi:hypothetical protein
MQEVPMPVQIAVDDADVEVLLEIRKSLQGHPVRYWWEPAAGRQQRPVKPTHVSIVSEEPQFVEYVLFELAKHRQMRQALHKTLPRLS